MAAPIKANAIYRNLLDLFTSKSPLSVAVAWDLINRSRVRVKGALVPTMRFFENLWTSRFYGHLCMGRSGKWIGLYLFVEPDLSVGRKQIDQSHECARAGSKLYSYSALGIVPAYRK